jgi:hypothetical protein
MYYTAAWIAQLVFVTRLRVEERGSIPGTSRDIFHFATLSRRALGPTQLPTHWVLGVLSHMLKRPGRESDHSPPPSAEFKNTWTYTSSSTYVFMAWCLVKYRICFHGVIIKPRDNFISIKRILFYHHLLLPSGN